MNISDIEHFFVKSTREQNDATNKIRERVLKNIAQIPQSYIEDKVLGEKWRILIESWNKAIGEVSQRKGIEEYTKFEVNHLGGRTYNYDYSVCYYRDENIIGEAHVEFKVGGKTISDSPQFLSLQAKFPMFEITYDRFWYENYLDQYIAYDLGITETKPPIEQYLKLVTNVKSDVHPFFTQLKNRENVSKREKANIVNRSIEEYLSLYGKSIKLPIFQEKVKVSQTDKNYLLWCENHFCIDGLSREEMTNMSVCKITKNTIIIESNGTKYGLLLRWRNHKGILNPAWQISLKRSR